MAYQQPPGQPGYYAQPPPGQQYGQYPPPQQQQVCYVQQREERWNMWHVWLTKVVDVLCTRPAACPAGTEEGKGMSGCLVSCISPITIAGMKC